MDARSISALALGAATIGLQALLWDRPLECAAAGAITAGSLLLALGGDAKKGKPRRTVRRATEQETFIQRVLR